MSGERDRAPSSSLRLLFVASRDARHPNAAGGERLLELLAEELAVQGHSVVFWSAGHPTLPREETVRGVRVERRGATRLFAPTVWVRLVGGRSDAFDLVVEETIGGERLPFLAFLLSSAPTMGAMFQDQRPLFRAMYGEGSLAAFAGALLQRLLLLAYRRGPMITCSGASRSWLVGQGIPREKVAVAYPRVQLPAGVAGAPWSARRNAFVSIGNFRPTKRFEEALEVLGLVRARVPDAQLDLVGRQYDPAYLARLRRRAGELGLSASAHFHLDVSEVEKFRLLASAKALTIHSPVEGFGWTIPEAGIVGVPAVGNPGVPTDALEAGITGEIVPFGDVAEYARVLTTWMGQEAAWKARSLSAQRAAERFQAPVLQPATEALIRASAKAR